MSHERHGLVSQHDARAPSSRARRRAPREVGKGKYYMKIVLHLQGRPRVLRPLRLMGASCFSLQTMQLTEPSSGRVMGPKGARPSLKISCPEAVVRIPRRLLQPGDSSFLQRMIALLVLNYMEALEQVPVPI